MTTEERRRIIADALHGAKDRPEPERPEPESPLQSPIQPALTPGYSYWGNTAHTFTPYTRELVAGTYTSTVTIPFPTSASYPYTQF